jgi:hypothetical protein
MQKNLTWSLVAVAALLFAFIFFYERRLQSSAEKAEPPRLFDPAARDIIAVEVTLTGKGTVRAEKTNDAWALTIPSYPAQQSLIETFVGDIAGLKKLDKIEAHEVVLQGQNSFGLAPPAATVTFNTATNQYSFEIGSTAPLTTNVYLRLEPSKEVVLASGTLVKSLPASTNDWRSANLVTLSGSAFDHIQVRVGPRVFEVGKNATNNLWQMTKPVPARADQERIAALLERVREAKVDQFVADPPGLDLEKYGLQNPEMELGFYRGTNRVYAVEFGSSPTNNPARIYTQLFGQTNIVLTDRSLAEYLQQPYKNFHDSRLLTLQPKRLDRITVNSLENFALQRQDDGHWVIDGKKSTPVDPELLNHFVGVILSMQIIDVAKEVPTESDLRQFGLVSPIASYSFFERQTNASGLLTNILFSDVLFGTNQADRIYVRRSDESPVYVTPLAKMIELPRRAFELRDRTIWNFPATNVARITLSDSAGTNTVARTPAGWVNDAIANAAIEETVFRLGHLKAFSWINKGEDRLRAFAIKEGSLTVSIEVKSKGKDQTYEVRFGRPTLRHDVYAAVVLPNDTEPTIFEFPGELYQSIQQTLPVPK